MTAYWNGEFRPKEEIRVSPDDRGFLFGDGVYEVICAHAGRLFKAQAHFGRLNRSLRELKIKPPVSQPKRVDKRSSKNPGPGRTG